ncbi:heme peroxidase [Tothia fuscella]|uniref:Peroxidase n=1 Tax=Tothia fuscella TaxID=1048955 RepID=A0A9P4U3F3_9PEZI|nr:heme peroxidase [Tothia fuscella]
MHSANLLAVLLASTSAQAASSLSNFDRPNLSRRQATTPTPPQAGAANANGYIAPPAAPLLAPPAILASMAAGVAGAAASAVTAAVPGAPPGFPPGPPPGVPAIIPGVPEPAPSPGAAPPGVSPDPNAADPNAEENKRKPRPGKPPGGPPGGPPQGKCPAVWTEVSKELSKQFMESGQCNDLARGAIRAAFHDCGAWEMGLGKTAGCDGSLILAKEEITRQENSGLVDIIPKLAAIGKKFDVGMADFIQFAGASAVKICPLGPTVQTWVGRKDSSTPNPENLLPNPRSDGDTLVQLFQNKGINPAELVALIGAHTSAKQMAFDPSKAGAPLDSSPGVWDVKFYGETIKKQAPFTLPSDIELSKQKDSAPVFKSFVNNQMGWGAAFAPAMTKLGLLGVEKEGLIDCTYALPTGAQGYRRAAVKRRWW